MGEQFTIYMKYFNNRRSLNKKEAFFYLPCILREREREREMRSGRQNIETEEEKGITKDGESKSQNDSYPADPDDNQAKEDREHPGKRKEPKGS